jgi:outer membrane protein OmpA-like peptidoglycan-associated protein
MAEVVAARQPTQTKADPNRSPASPTAQGVSARPGLGGLQRALGNHGMQRLLRSGAIQTKLRVGPANDEYEREADRVAAEVMRMPDPRADAALHRAPLTIQRLCSECKEEKETGELQRAPITIQRLCPECEEEERVVQRWIGPPDVQRKLQVGTPAGPLGQDADPMARPVVEMPASDLAPPAFPPDTLQRKCAACGEGKAPCPTCAEEEGEQAKAVFSGETPSVHRQVAGGVDSLAPGVTDHLEGELARQGSGERLSPSDRAFYESRFGLDFGHVRVHTGRDALEASRKIGALAFTHGSHIYFGAGQSPANVQLTAHELTHVVQQKGAVPRGTGDGHRSSPAAQGTSKPATSQVCDVIQRAGDPTAIPPGIRCPTDLTAGRPAGTDLLFPNKGSIITPAHTALLTTFRATWQAAGGTDNILVHGYASTDGDQATNWTLSCDRAEAVKAELERLGIPAVRIDDVAHGESTDFGSGAAPNRHVVVSTSSPGILPLPLVTGTLTPRDNFAGRSATRFGVGEVIDLNFVSFPSRPAADFGGLEWHLAAGAGTLASVTNVGTATYAAPPAAGAARLELRVASGATAGRVVTSHAITIVAPSGVRMTEVPGTAPNFSPGGPIAAGVWGAGFQGDPFIDPKDVSFIGVMFGEGTVPSVITGSFLSGFAAVHPVGGLVPGQGGNLATGTPLSPAVDSIFTGGRAPVTRLFGKNICGDSDFLWAIPWEFSVAGGPRIAFAIANHHATSSTFCEATIEKAGAGPFKRSI